MNQLNLFIELTRLKKPIGYMLLFWPCIWGLTLVYDFSQNKNIYFFYLILFFLGAVLMRSAGCIVNDVLDRKFDKLVVRTKDRPIASGKISVKLSLFYAAILCLLAFIVLINFNLFTILLALASMPLAFTYPLMKRYTYWPQLFLGVTFNYGLVLAWASVSESLHLVPLTFYIGAIFWTLGYDTIYGYQDIKDDEIIDRKSLIMEKTATLKRLFNEYTKKYIKKIAIAVFFSLLVAASTSSIAWLLDPAIDKIFIQKDQSLLIIIPFLIIIAFTTKGVSLYLAKVIMINVGEDIKKKLQFDMLNTLISADTQSIDEKHTGKFISNLTYDVLHITNLLSHGILNLFKDSLTLIGLLTEKICNV